MRAVLAENDNLFGPRQVITAAQEQTRLIAAHLRHGTVSPVQRQTLLHIQTQFADLLGWLHQDIHTHSSRIMTSLWSLRDEGRATPCPSSMTTGG